MIVANEGNALMVTKGSTISDQEAEKITRTEELAYEIRIKEVMTKNVFCLQPEMKMETALNIFQTIRFSGAPV